jgi:hypothetical protein
MVELRRDENGSLELGEGFDHRLARASRFEPMGPAFVRDQHSSAASHPWRSGGLALTSVHLTGYA